MPNVAINGFGRIGRAAFKILDGDPDLRVVAINDLAPLANLAYLLKYDTVYGRYGKRIEAATDALMVDGARYPFFSETDPAKLPWRQAGVDLVFECTGVFNKRHQLEPHLKAGAKHVLLSAPAKDEEIVTVVHGVNQPSVGAEEIVSCASCTTNCITPVIEILGRRIGLKKAVMTSVHGYTATQSVVDGPKKKIRSGRAAAVNLIPATTGAAVATTKALPQYRGKFDGVAVRVPVPNGSLADIVLLASRPTTVEEVNGVLREEADSPRYRGIVAVTDEPLVSSDIIREPYAAIADLGLTQVVDGDLVKVMCWYDNEWGYANQMVREAKRLLGV
jgi:glyceraldehyde 3-phosphate dehydrogenase